MDPLEALLKAAHCRLLLPALAEPEAAAQGMYGVFAGYP
jgi:hypothetical protein